MTAKKRKVVSLICIILVIAFLATLLVSAVGSAYAVSQSQIDALKNKQSSVAAQKDAIKDKISSLESDIGTYLEKKKALDEQNELARQEIELISEQIDLYEKLVKEKEAELVEAKKVEEKQKEELRVRMRGMEENGDLSYIAILFKATSFTDFLAKYSDIKAIMENDKALEEAYIEAREHVEEVKAEYEQTLHEQEGAKVEMEAKKADLEKQIAVAEGVIEQLETDVENNRAEYEANQAQEQAIQNQISQLEAQLAQQNASNGTTAPSGTGTLSWPVAGTSTANISSYFGWRTHPIFGDQRFHSGIDIAAGSGTTIMAADSGTVLSAVYHSSYGNYVVISHGNGLSTLYAHMSQMAVTAGQTVSKGQTIGYVGSTGWSTGAHCHYEVRVGSNRVNPLDYY